MRTSAAVAAVVLSLSLVGCSGDPVAEPLPPLPTALPSPSVVAAPSPPAEALEETPQGAEAFVRFYMDVLTQAFQEADTTLLTALSDPGCEGCQNFIGAAEDADNEGAYSEGGVFTVEFAAAPPIQNDDVVVEFRYSRAPGRLLTADGSLAEDFPAEPPLDAQVRLKRSGGTWVVMGFRATPE